MLSFTHNHKENACLELMDEIFKFLAGKFKNSRGRLCNVHLFRLFGRCSAREGRALSGYRILRPELSKVDSKDTRKLTLLEPGGELTGGGDLGTSGSGGGCTGGQPGQN